MTTETQTQETENPNLYGHGKPFSETLDVSISDQIKRIERNKASLLIIDGGVGEGKTTLAVEVADDINRRKGFPPIKYEEQLAMGGSDFTKKLRLCYTKKLPCIIYDEAGDFNKRGALTRFNAMLNRTFETFRAFKIIVILVLPSFRVLDNDLFDKNIPRLLLHCQGRSQKYGNFKGYGLYRMLYVKEKMKKLTVKTFAYNLVEANFRGHFLDLSPERSKALDKFTIKGKIKELKNTEVKIDGLLTYQEVAQRLALSVNRTRTLVNELSIKPSRVIDRKKYFDNGVVDQIANYQDGLEKKPGTKDEYNK